jgi:hypothetical protein
VQLLFALVWSSVKLYQVPQLTVADSHHITHLPHILRIPEANLLFARHKGVLQLFLLELLLSSSSGFTTLSFNVLQQFRASVERGDHGADCSDNLYPALSIARSQLLCATSISECYTDTTHLDAGHLLSSLDVWLTWYDRDGWLNRQPATIGLSYAGTLVACLRSFLHQRRRRCPVLMKITGPVFQCNAEPRLTASLV